MTDRSLAAINPPATTPMPEDAFKRALVAEIPYLRAFGRSLCGNRDRADDLAQDTLIKGFKSRLRFQAGTNLRAWLFTILRNHYYSECRRDSRQMPWNDEAMNLRLTTGASQHAALEVVDLYQALQRLPNEQREALILVGAGGLSYEEVSEICGCAVGTIKSRVSRARRALETIMDSSTQMSAKNSVTTETAMDRILGETKQLSDK